MATQEFPSFTSPIGKEGVLMLKNPSAWNFLSDWFGAAVLIVAGLAGLRVHPAFGVLALVGLLFAFVKAVLLNTTVYLVTDKRVIVKKGLISQHVSEVRISDIRGVNLRQGIWHRDHRIAISSSAPPRPPGGSSFARRVSQVVVAGSIRSARSDLASLFRFMSIEYEI